MCFRTWWDHRDGDYLPHCTTRKPHKLYEIMILRHWATDNTVICKRKKTMNLDLYVLQLRASLWMYQKEDRPRAQQSCWVEEIELKFRKDEQFSGQHTRIQRAAQKEPGRSVEGSPRVLVQCWCAPLYKETPKSGERTTAKEYSKQSPELTEGQA